MPRIYTSANDPLDFCCNCFPGESEAKETYGNIMMTGEGPDGRGNCFEYDAFHPPYDGNDYRCIECGAALDDDD